METEINADYDNTTYLEAIERIKQFTQYRQIKGVKIRISASGLGFHIRVKLREKIGRGERLFSRLLLGDDRVRVLLDWRLPHRIEDNLWDSKRGMPSGRWVDITDSIVSG